MREANERFRLFVSPFRQRIPALFLGWDGVVIEDCHHLSDPDHVRLCPGSRQLIASAQNHGWPIFLITNQSGIARGFFEWSHVEWVNLRMQELLAPEAPFAAIYANGHGPDAPSGSWRKPSPQMLLEAATALNLDLGRSMLIGDRLSDLQAGSAAGLAIFFHVLSGHGRNARASVVQWYEQRRQAGDTSAVSGLQLLDGLEEFPLPRLKQGTPAPR